HAGMGADLHAPFAQGGEQFLRVKEMDGTDQPGIDQGASCARLLPGTGQDEDIVRRGLAMDVQEALAPGIPLHIDRLAHERRAGKNACELAMVRGGDQGNAKDVCRDIFADYAQADAASQQVSDIALDGVPGAQQFCQAGKICHLEEPPAATCGDCASRNAVWNTRAPVLRTSIRHMFVPLLPLITQLFAQSLAYRLDL